MDYRIKSKYKTDHVIDRDPSTSQLQFNLGKKVDPYYKNISISI